LACAAALAGIELLTSDEIQKNIGKIIQWHQEFDAEIKDHPKVAATRQTGIIYALDLNIVMERYGNVRDKLFKHFMDSGVFLRPLGNTIYILAPYITTKEQMQKIYNSIKEVLNSF
jgi:adenosylmethionine-8-amino-7-oxononanoate aminotransferase